MPSKVPILPLIKEFVASKGWKVYKEDHDSVCMLFGPNTSDLLETHLLLLHTRDQEADMRVVARACANVSEDKRERMAEFFGRANFGLNHGCFKLDMADGEMKFYTAIDTENCSTADVKIMLEYYVNIATATWSKYLPGIKQIIQNNTDVSAIIQSIEQ